MTNPEKPRRRLLRATGALLAAPALGALAAVPWETVQPEAAGFVANLDDRFDAALKAGRLDGIHGVVALRGGRIVFERYLQGVDESWGKSLGEVAFGPDTLHDMRSVTKSIVGLLYGIALARGQVPAPDQPLMPHFARYADLAADPALARLTIGHALTMTMGMEWNEDLPYTNPANSEIAMENATDRYRFILSRRVLVPPGREWTYSGGAVALLGHLIEQGTGRDLPAFAREALFEPLGITDSEWKRGADGVASPASGLRLTPRSLARIGQLIVARGAWEGRTVVPSSWLDASFRPAAQVDEARRYGYLWYLVDWTLRGKAGIRAEPFVGAFGLGGQRLFVFPGLDFVVSITAGNYSKPDQWLPPIIVLREVLSASLAR